jgi:ABC-type Mn2+/Zn2+ transport system permease subunit
VLGALGGVAGLAVSYQWELPSGVAIIFVLTASLIVAKLLSLRHESAKTRRG